MSSAELAKQQMHGFGGMLSIDVVGGGKAAECVEDHLQVFLLAAAYKRVSHNLQAHFRVGFLLPSELFAFQPEPEQLTRSTPVTYLPFSSSWI